jgi:hypothetical protein
MLAQWLEAHGDLPETMVYLARDLAISAMSEESSASTSHWLERIVSEPGLDPFLPQLWATRMAHRTGLVERLDDLLTRRALERPIEVAPVIYDLVLHRLTTASVGALAARDLSLLSRLAAATSPDEVWAQLQNWSDQDLAAALAHMDWRGAAPDPLVRLFLLSNRLSALGSPAYAAFFNTLGTVVGPYYLALEREQQRAEAWRNALRGTSAEAWIADVIDRYGREVDWHRQRDAESDAHLR